MNNTITYSAPDSNRFGLNIYRGNLSTINTNEISTFITEKNIDILILRIPVELKELQYQIGQIGYPHLHADTLVYYYSDLQTSLIKEARNQLDFEVITDLNSSVLNNIVPVIFNDYKNHYFSNPLLNKQKIKEGYVEWAKSYCSSNEGKISWLIKRTGNYIGFATCHFDYATKECEGILYGVLPEYAGGGVYTDIIRFTKQYFKDENFHTMKVSTQIQNFAVQKAWVKEDFFLKTAYDTYHINSCKTQ